LSGGLGEKESSEKIRSWLLWTRKGLGELGRIWEPGLSIVREKKEKGGEKSDSFLLPRKKKTAQETGPGWRETTGQRVR